MTNRGWRAMETYGADEHITADSFHKYKYDLTYGAESPEEEMYNSMAVDPGQDRELQEALKL